MVLKPNKSLDGSREVSYRESLIRVTSFGGVTAAIFISFFILLFWALDFPRNIILINVAALLIDLIGLMLVSRFHIHKPAAHLITFATYFSLLGTALLTGGIDSSSIVWMAFIPIAATIMAGNRDAIPWGVISLISIVGIYLLNREWGLDWTLVPPKSIDRMIDLVAVTIVIGTATWLNERTKAHAMNHLESARAMLNHLATVDPLTNAFNRRYFFDRAQVELEIAKLRKNRTSILLLDIDHFKKINDTYGHTVGDQILIGLVTLCQVNLREMDTLARLGGEEFVILLPETDLAEARHIAERLRRTLEHTPIQTDAGGLHVTISIGALSHPTTDDDLPVHKLVQQADQAMYLAKRSGRNRVVTWQNQGPPQNSAD
jgi:diguanylate cyclase (GGDEF)-like protein